jgi:hypothetical protein
MAPSPTIRIVASSSVRADRTVRPPPFGEHKSRFVETPSQREEVQDSQLSAAIGVSTLVAGHAGDQNAEGGRSRDVHGIEADAKLMHQPERSRGDDLRSNPPAKRADHVHAVEVVRDLVRRAGGELPAGQLLGQLIPRQVRADLLATEQDLHSRGARTAGVTEATRRARRRAYGVR